VTVPASTEERDKNLSQAETIEDVDLKPSGIFMNGKRSVRVIHRSQWPRGLGRRSAAAWLLGSRVRIPLRAWMFVSCFPCVYRGLCDGLITRPEESYHAYTCV
jgi:hypothetical protein